MDTKSERPTPKGGRGKKTREQLLAAGLEAFAKYGPDGITTRQLAKAAGANSAAIAYYFGGKEGYYIAVIKHHIEQQATPVFSLLAEISEELNRSNRSPEVARRLLNSLIHTLIVTVFLSPNAKSTASIYSREHLQPTSAFELIYKEIDTRLHSTLSELVACVTQKPVDSPETIIRAHALLGQVLYFRITATSMCRRLRWDEITEKRAEFIAQIVAEMAIRSLGMEPAGQAEKEKEERSWR